MMPQRIPSGDHCPDCRGFAAVAITTGRRTPAGRRETITVTCRPCGGTGRTTATPLTAYAHQGRGQ